MIAIATSSKKTINGYAVRRRRNPFITGTHAGIGDVQACDTESRIDMVRNFSAEQCRAALKLRYLQKTVRVALDRRLRALEAKS